MRAFENILTHRPTDTAPLLRYVKRLCFVLIGLVEDGYHHKAEVAAQWIYSAARVMCRLELANAQRRLKLDMLSHKYWRRQVLRELGGEGALARWNAAAERVKLQGIGVDILPYKPRQKTCPKTHLKTGDARAQHPRIHNEPYRMDFEGEFRLPPVPRLNRKRPSPRRLAKTVSTQRQPRPITVLPIRIWPAEFHAAEAWDYACWLRKHCAYKKADATHQKATHQKAKKPKVKSKADPKSGIPFTLLRRLPVSLRAGLDIGLHQDRAYEAAT